MNSNSAQYSRKKFPKRGRTSRVLPTMLIVLLLNAVPALAEPVKFNQVVQSLTRTQGVVDLRLDTLAQDPKKDGESVAKAKDSKQTDGKTESVISSVVFAGDGKTIGVEEIADGEVEGTICDCGEIFIAGASFPKWPFLFLAAVPLVFIDRDSDEQPTPTPPPNSSPTPTPTPTTTPTPTPEPASLLLFGTGLLAAGAGLRKRHAKSKIKEGQ